MPVASCRAEAVREKKEADRLRNKLEAQDFEVEQLKDDIDKMASSSSTAKSVHRDLYTLRKDERVQEVLQRQLKKANNQLNKQTDQLGALVDNNQQLETQVKDLTGALTRSVAEMHHSTEKIEELQQMFRVAEADAEAAVHERDILQHRLADTEDKYEKHVGSDDAIIESVNATVEKWKSMLGEKDAQIAGMQQVIVSLQEDLEMHSRDREEGLIEQVGQQGHEIAVLKEQLQQATDALDETTAERLMTRAMSPESIDGEGLKFKIAGLEKQCDRLQEENANTERDRIDLLHKIDAYERGVYGLHTAQEETKRLNAQLKSMDDNLGRKTTLVNKVQGNIADLADENEELRARLGMDRGENVSLTDVRNARQVEMETLRTVNRELLRDVDRLEEERRKLKQRLIQQAMDRGGNAAKLGLGTMDLMLAEELADHQERLGAEQSPLHSSALRVSMLGATMGADAVSRKDYEALQDRCRSLEGNAAVSDKLRDAAERLETENALLQRSVNEIGLAMSAAKHGEKDTPVQLPAVAQLLAILRTNRTVGAGGGGGTAGDGGGGVGSALTEEALSHLKGQNAELRNQLRIAQSAAKDSHEAAARFKTTAKMLQSQRPQQERDASDGTKLPSDLTQSSAAVVAALTEQMVELMQELALRTSELQESENALGDMKRSLAVLTHQQDLVYQQHEDILATHQVEVHKLAKEKAVVVASAEANAIYETQLEQLQSLLKKDPNDIKQVLGDMDRKNTVYKINNAALARRLNLVKADHTAMSDKVERTQAALQEATAWFRERSGYLTRRNASNEEVIQQLQERLERSVDRDEVDKVNRRCNTLAAKLRARMEVNNRVVEHGLGSSVGFFGSNAADDAERLQKDLGHALARENKLTQQVDALRSAADGGAGAGSVELQKIHTLEMQVLHERQRSDLTQLRRDKDAAIAQELEKRNLHLDSKVIELTETHLTLQNQVRELTDQLTDCITQETHDATLQLLEEAKKQRATLLEEASHLKETAEIARQQAEVFRTAQKSEIAERASLQERLLDIESQSDERSSIGKLHRQVLALKAGNNELIGKVENKQHEQNQQRALLFRLEQKLSEANDTLRRVRTDAKKTSNHLRGKLQALRLQYSGALTLDEQEKATDTLHRLQTARARAEKELESASTQRASAEDKVAAWQLKYDELQQLLLDVKQGRGSSKVVDWHQKMVDARVSELQLKRQLDRAEEHGRFVQGLFDESERRIAALEKDTVSATKDFEHRQMLWEQREDELEGAIEKHEINAEKKDVDAEALLRSVTADYRWAPDPSATLALQLEEAINTVHKLGNILVDHTRDLEAADDNVAKMNIQMKTWEAQVQQQEGIIMDLRLQYHSEPPQGDALSELQHHRDASDTAVKVAQETISSLRELLHQKDEAITKLRMLMGEAHGELLRERAVNSEALGAFNHKIQTLEVVVQQARDGLSSGLSADSNALAQFDVLNSQVVELDEEAKDQRIRADTAERGRRDAEEDAAAVKEQLQSQLRRLEMDDKETVARLEAQIHQLHGDNIKLSERNENFEQNQDFMKAHVSAEQEKSAMVSEQLMILKEKHQMALEAVQKKEGTIKKLKYEVDSMSLRAGHGFGGKTRSRAPPSRTATLGARAGPDDLSMSMADEVPELQEKLTKLAGGMTKAQSVIKRQKEKYADSDKKRQRAEGELVKALELIKDHEAESKRLRGKLAEAEQRLRATAKEHANAHSMNEDLQSKLQLAENQSTAADRLQSQQDTDVLVAQLQKRIRNLESRRTDENVSGIRKDRGGSTSDWEADKKRQKFLEGLKARVKQQAADLESSQAQLQQLHDTVKRLERERSSLQKKNRRLAAANEAAPTAQAAADGNPVSSARIPTAELIESRRELVAAQGRVKSLELELAQARSLASNPTSAAEIDVLALREKADTEARRRLASENDKMSITFELEHAKTEISALKHQLKVVGDVALNPTSKATEASKTTVSNLKYMELHKAHKKLKAQFEKTQTDNPSGDLVAARSAAEMDRLRASLKREREVLAKTKKKFALLETQQHARDSQPAADPTTESLEAYRRQVADHIVQTKDLKLRNKKLGATILQKESQLEAEVQRRRDLHEENEKLHQELDAIDPEFIDEIFALRDQHEDLKHSHAVALKSNATLTEELGSIARTHGVKTSVTS